MTPVTIAAVAVAFVGLVVTVAGDLGAGDMTGNVSAVLAAVGFAGYAVCVRTDVRRDWSPVMPGYAVMMIVLCGAITLAGGRPLVPPAPDVALAVIHGGVFIVVGTTLFNVASPQVPAVAMAVFAQTEMLFVPIWALLVLDERPGAATLAGGAIIFVAVIGKALVDARSMRLKRRVLSLRDWKFATCRRTPRSRGRSRGARSPLPEQRPFAQPRLRYRPDRGRLGRRAGVDPSTPRCGSSPRSG